jgi:hydrogenase maturation protease
VKVEEAFTGGMNLLDLMRGYERAILIDTIQQPDKPVGSIARYTLSDLPTIHSNNPHDTSLTEAIILSKNLGDHQIPKEIIIYGITLHHMTMEFTDKLSPIIKKAIPKITRKIMSDIKLMNN